MKIGCAGTGYINKIHAQAVHVPAKIGTHYKDYDVDDTGVMIVEWDNGTTSYIETGWWQPHADSPESGAQLYGLKGFGSVFPTQIQLLSEEEEKVDVIESGFPPQESHQPQSLYDDQLNYFIQCIERKHRPGRLDQYEIGRCSL